MVNNPDQVVLLLEEIRDLKAAELAEFRKEVARSTRENETQVSFQREAVAQLKVIVMLYKRALPVGVIMILAALVIIMVVVTARLSADVVHYNDGMAHQAEGRLDQAITEFDRAIKLNPQYGQAYYRRGIIFSEQDKLDEAIADFDQAINLNPQWPGAYYTRACSKDKRGNDDQAKKDFLTFIDLAGSDASMEPYLKYSRERLASMESAQ